MIISQRQKTLQMIKPYLITLRDLLEQLSQVDPCSEWKKQYLNDLSVACSDMDYQTYWYGSTGALACFECIFTHLGVVLPNFGEVDRTTQVTRFQALLSAYLTIDRRLLDIIMRMKNCDISQSLEKLPSILDYLLQDPITINYSLDEETLTAETGGTNLITIPEGLFADVSDNVGYQNLLYVFVHEIGHVFHNRLQEVIYGDDRGGTVILTMPDGTQRTVTLPGDTPGAVRNYLQAVGGYYTDIRDYNYPSEYSNFAQPLTSLNYNGRELPLDTLYASPGIIRQNIREDFRVHTEEGKEFVYLRGSQNPTPENQPTAYFIEANTYIASADEVENYKVYFPNEIRPSAEPKEGFADSFAAYLLEPSILQGTRRGEFFDQNIENWLCKLIQEASK